MSEPAPSFSNSFLATIEYEGLSIVYSFLVGNESKKSFDSPEEYQCLENVCNQHLSARSRPEAKSHYVHRPLRSTSTYISTLLYSTVAAPMAIRRVRQASFASGISESSVDDAARRRGEAFLESERPSSSRR